MSFSKYSIKSAQTLLLAGSLVTLSACLDTSQFKKVETNEQKVAYSVGYNFGQKIAESTDELELDYLIAGLRDGWTGSGEKVNAEDRVAVLREFAQRKQTEMMEKRAAVAEENKTSGVDFLEKNKEKEGVVVTESGLQYKVITEGEGKQPAATDTVKVHYKGTLIDGSVFDSSIDRGEPAQFPLNRVIPGWTEALQLMKEGSKWEVYIPSELGYGERGSGMIEPHSTLIFEVELLEVLGSSEAADPHSAH